MGLIDDSLIALAAYILFSLVLSYSLSIETSHTSGPIPVVPLKADEPSAVFAKKNKKEKVIKIGFQARCLVCDRTFETDTYLKNHLEGQKHVKKALTFQGPEVFKLEKIPKKA